MKKILISSLFFILIFIISPIFVGAVSSGNDQGIITLSKIEPASGPVGTQVTITGSNFGPINTVIIETDNYGVGDTGQGKKGADTYRSIDFKVSSSSSDSITFKIPSTIINNEDDAHGNIKTTSLPMIPALYNIAVRSDDAKSHKSINFRVTAGSSDVKKPIVFKQGSKGDDVKEIQTLLKNGGYLKATPNGTFGPQTKTAVMNFQRKMKLKATGIVDEKTKNLLIEKVKEIESSKKVSSNERKGACVNVAIKAEVSSSTPKSVDVVPGQKNIDMTHYTFEGDGKITQLFFNVNMDTGDGQTNPKSSLIPVMRLYDESGKQIGSAKFNMTTGYVFSSNSLVVLKKGKPRTVSLKADIADDVKNKQAISTVLNGCDSNFTDSKTGINKKGFLIHDVDQMRIGQGNSMTILGETPNFDLLNNQQMGNPVGFPAGN